MKNYTITVNGVSYDVTVEENTSRNTRPQASPLTMGSQMPSPIVQKTEPVEKTSPAPSGLSSPTNQGSGIVSGRIKIESPMPGKIVAIKIKVGDRVKHGDIAFILEAMKMENEIVISDSGTITSIDVVVGDMVEAGRVLSTLS